MTEIISAGITILVMFIFIALGYWAGYQTGWDNCQKYYNFKDNK